MPHVEPIIRVMPSSRRRPPEEPDEPAPSPVLAGDEAMPNAMLVLIVTGSTILAETRDRPLAYRLRERMLAWLDARSVSPGDAAARLEPVVCSDLWYLNAKELEERPAIAIGEPGSNAATAVISNRLPTAFIIEGSLRVHLDPEFIDLRAALWGASAAATASAIDLFAERYMNDFLDAAG